MLAALVNCKICKQPTLTLSIEAETVTCSECEDNTQLPQIPNELLVMNILNTLTKTLIEKYEELDASTVLKESNIEIVLLKIEDGKFKSGIVVKDAF
jgi:hypothetical protein